MLLLLRTVLALRRPGVPCLRMPFGHVLDAPALRASGFAPCSPYGGPVFRVCALRFAPCARHSSRFAASGFAPILNSAWSSHCAHKLACGTPCFIGVFVPACASLARYSGAAERFALSSPLHPFGASTASACFAHCARPSCAPALTLARCSAPAASGFAPPSPYGGPKAPLCKGSCQRS